MGMFLFALAVFLLLHVVPAVPGIRAALIARMGRKAYFSVYSILSLAVLAWAFHAALTMEFVPLWDPARWQAWITLVLAPAGMFLVLAGLFSVNPLSITVRQVQETPGAIVAVTRHPVLWGFLLWSAGHLVPNGDLRSLLLFGSLALFAIGGFFMVERRTRRRLGAAWHRLAAPTSILPLAGILSGRARLAADWAMIGAALATALTTLWLLTGGHLALFGADPLLLALPR